MSDDIKPLSFDRPKRQIRTFLKKYAVIASLIFAFLIIGLVILPSSTNNPSVINLVLGKKTSLELDNNRVNILLLGMAGGKHEGATLTDTIMVATIDFDSGKTDLISLPRDLWVEDHQAKINTIYQLGLKEQKGLQLTREEIGQMLGLNIPYAVRIDFAGFVKAVDLIEGVNIDIPNAFDDYLYPIEGKKDDYCGYKEQEVEIDEEKSKQLNVPEGKRKALLAPDGNIATVSAQPDNSLIYTPEQVYKLFSCRYEHISFKKGSTILNGEKALKYVRSRTGTNGEGNDFARSKRQQLILQAFKDQVLSVGTLTDPQKVTGLAATFGDSFETDIPAAHYVEFLGLLKKVNQIKSHVIDAGGKDALLIAPAGGKYGAWVLIPPNNDFSKIQEFVHKIITNQLDIATPSATIKP